YAAGGLLFGLAFVGFGLDKVDAAAHATPLAFRLLILPGVVAFWPLLALKWLKAARHGGRA
ncbi:MAG: hypothetical protein L0099_04640, partial [Acidobacteria bacterium]|nr:hypothetical protein [Acidobacteriota bacterium]